MISISYSLKEANMGTFGSSIVRIHRLTIAISIFSFDPFDRLRRRFNPPQRDNLLNLRTGEVSPTASPPRRGVGAAIKLLPRTVKVEDQWRDTHFLSLVRKNGFL